MSEPFVCECVFVEARNESDPRAGRIEYRAETCPTCRYLDARLLAGSTAAALFDSAAPKHQTLH